MSDNSENDKSAKQAKAFDAFAVRNDKDGKGHFHKIGAAFPHKDGEGLDVDLVATPSNGRLTLRTPQERLQNTRKDAKGKQSRRRENDHVRG